MSAARGRPLLFQILILMLLAVLAAQLANVVVVLTAPPPGNRQIPVDTVARIFGSTGAPPSGFSRAAQPQPPFDDFEDDGERRYRARLAQAMGRPLADVRVVLHGERAAAGGPPDASGLPPPPMPRTETPFGAFEDRVFVAAVRQPDGRWLTVRAQQTGFLQDWQKRALLWFLASLLLVVPLGYWLARRLTAPIRGFADAAERLGRDPRAAALELRGPREIQAAAAAFNVMQERLARYVEDRTAMVGAIAHDLRTPLTRLAFRLEDAPEAVREKAVRDIAEMEAMIAATLDFVRDTSSAPARAPLDLASLVESAADDLQDSGRNARAEPGERLVIHGDSAALRRLVDNLLSNATTYGASAVARVHAQDGFAIIEVDDEGPGLPDAELARVFEPFYRTETSRSRETGGIGLGLAVARTIAHAHGGEIALANRPEGGLRARVTLPI